MNTNTQPSYPTHFVSIGVMHKLSVELKTVGLVEQLDWEFLAKMAGSYEVGYL